MRKYLAEFVGTFVLVLGGVGTAVLAGPRVGYLGIALAFGLALLAMAFALGPISGCHINPAVTLAMYLRRRISPRDAGLYMVAQVAGAIVGAFVVLLVAKGLPGGYSASVSGLAANGYGAHSPSGYSGGSAFLLEALLTAVLCLTVLSASNSKAPAGLASIPIGLVLALIHLLDIPVTNASVNPARSIGPALFVGGWALGQLWLFIVAPLLGAGLASLVDQALREAEPSARRADQALPGAREESPT